MGNVSSGLISSDNAWNADVEIRIIIMPIVTQLLMIRIRKQRCRQTVSVTYNKDAYRLPVVD